jgi:hypothetical protein
MKAHLVSLTFFVAAAAWAADSADKETVQKAVTKLQSASSYAWTANYTMGGDGGGGGGGKMEGKADKSGQATMNLEFGGGNMLMDMAIKGTNGAMKRDGEWQSFADIAAENPRFGAMLKEIKTPAKQLTDLLKYTGDLKVQDGVYSADLSAAGVKEMLAFGRSAGIEVSNPKGSVKFWVKDGNLTKFEYQNSGTVSFDGNDRDLDVKTTVEIKDVGTAKVTIPEEAAKKLGA